MTITRPNANAYAKGLVDYHGRQEAQDVARMILARCSYDAFRIQLDTRHKGVFGDPDYWMQRLDITLQALEWDATTLALVNIVSGIGPMLAGDMIRLRVTRLSPDRDDVVTFRYRGKPERDTFARVSDRELTEG